jgi:hypothetical protein
MKYDLKSIGEDTYLVYSRGHHDIEDFTKYVKEEYSEWGDFFSAAYHHYYRKIGNQYGTWYDPCFSWERGAFPVTVAQEGWEDQTGFIAKKILEGKHVKSIGNYYILNHYYMKNKFELWYAPNNTVATELRTFNSVEEAEVFIKSWLDKGRV